MAEASEAAGGRAGSRTPGVDDAVLRVLGEAKTSLVSDPSLTETRAREILREIPDSPEALFLLGAALRRQGNAKRAKEILEPLVALQPRSRAVRFEFGQALAILGEHRAAVTVLSQTVELDRNHAEAWRALGEQLQLIGDHSGSEAALAQAAILSVGNPTLAKALAAIRDKRPDDAEELLLEFLDSDPDNANAVKLLGEIALRDQRHDDAEALFERCLELSPDFADARCSYATTLLGSHKHRQAIAELEKLLARDPRNAAYRNLMGGALIASGEMEKSLSWHEMLVRECPSDAAAWLGYGYTLDAMRREEQCIAAYRRSIELCPWFGAAYSSLAELNRFRFTDGEIAAMEAQLARSELSDEVRISLHFALGKAYETRESYPESFENYCKGNALRRSAVRYYPDQTTDLVMCSRELFTSEFFRERAGAGCKLSGPIFIVGMPRSGSTLIEQILASHSAVEGVGELAEIPDLVRQIHYDYGGADYPEVLGALEAADLRTFGEQYLERTRIHRKLERPFFTDKAPSNFSDIGLIHLILPNAKIIDARRHPLGCCFSNFRQNYARGQTFTYSLNDLGRCYREYVALMSSFDEVLPGKVHRVFYEEMVANPEHEVRLLLDYLELPFEDQCLRFYEHGRYVRTASSDQVRRPIFKSAVEHWRNYEPWLGPLKEALGDVLDAYPGVPPFKA